MLVLKVTHIKERQGTHIHTEGLFVGFIVNFNCATGAGSIAGRPNAVVLGLTLFLICACQLGTLTSLQQSQEASSMSKILGNCNHIMLTIFLFSPVIKQHKWNCCHHELWVVQ